MSDAFPSTICTLVAAVVLGSFTTALCPLVSSGGYSSKCIELLDNSSNTSSRTAVNSYDSILTRVYSDTINNGDCSRGFKKVLDDAQRSSQQITRVDEEWCRACRTHRGYTHTQGELNRHRGRQDQRFNNFVAAQGLQRWRLHDGAFDAWQRSNALFEYRGKSSMNSCKEKTLAPPQCIELRDDYDELLREAFCYHMKIKGEVLMMLDYTKVPLSRMVHLSIADLLTIARKVLWRLKVMSQHGVKHGGVSAECIVVWRDRQAIKACLLPCRATALCCSSASILEDDASQLGQVLHQMLAKLPLDEKKLPEGIEFANELLRCNVTATTVA